MGPACDFGAAKKIIGGLYGKKMFRYVSDFGDNLELRIKVEKSLPAITSQQVPCRIDGANARPPEDIGGAPGYEYFLAALVGCRQNQGVSRRASMRASASHTHASLTANNRSWCMINLRGLSFQA